MNVLVIAEDYRYDQYILKPIVQAMMDHLGKPHATVQMCRDPMLRGWPQVRNRERIEEVININPMADVYVLVVDRDGVEARRAQLDAIEHDADNLLRIDQSLLSECAHQEVEVWLLAGHDLPNEWNWNDVRAEPHPKEYYYEPFAERRRLFEAPGEGRKRLGDEAARRYGRVRQLCGEVEALEGRVKAWLEGDL